jgi:hypothetical protein
LLDDDGLAGTGAVEDDFVREDGEPGGEGGGGGEAGQKGKKR